MTRGVDETTDRDGHGTTTDCPLPSFLADRFDEEGVLGRGGMGTVWAARRRVDGRPVALKVMAGELVADPAFRRRFRREARLAGGAIHPALVAIYEAGEEKDGLWIAMERIEGPSLRALIAAERPLAEARALGLIAELAACLAALHEAGVVHRDVKADNVMVDGAGRLRLLDLGLARDLGEDGITRTGQILGSVDTLAPEVCRGERAGPPADVFALGIILADALSPSDPFEEARARPGRLLAERAAGRGGVPVPVGLCPATAALIEELCRDDPGTRPATGGAALVRIEEASELLEARREAGGRRTALFGRQTAPVRNGTARLRGAGAHATMAGDRTVAEGRIAAHDRGVAGERTVAVAPVEGRGSRWFTARRAGGLLLGTVFCIAASAWWRGGSPGLSGEGDRGRGASAGSAVSHVTQSGSSRTTKEPVPAEDEAGFAEAFDAFLASGSRRATSPILRRAREMAPQAAPRVAWRALKKLCERVDSWREGGAHLEEEELLAAMKTCTAVADFLLRVPHANGLAADPEFHDLWYGLGRDLRGAEDRWSRELRKRLHDTIGARNMVEVPYLARRLHGVVRPHFRDMAVALRDASLRADEAAGRGEGPDVPPSLDLAIAWVLALHEETADRARASSRRVRAGLGDRDASSGGKRGVLLATSWAVEIEAAAALRDHRGSDASTRRALVELAPFLPRGERSTAEMQVVAKRLLHAITTGLGVWVQFEFPGNRDGCIRLWRHVLDDPLARILGHRLVERVMKSGRFEDDLKERLREIAAEKGFGGEASP